MKPASISTASGKLGGAGEGARRLSARRITTATPISTKKSVISHKIRTSAGFGFTLRATPPMGLPGSLYAPEDNTPELRCPLTPPPHLPR